MNTICDCARTTSAALAARAADLLDDHRTHTLDGHLASLSIASRALANVIAAACTLWWTNGQKLRDRNQKQVEVTTNAIKKYSSMLLISSSGSSFSYPRQRRSLCISRKARSFESRASSLLRCTDPRAKLRANVTQVAKEYNVHRTSLDQSGSNTEHT